MKVVVASRTLLPEDHPEITIVSELTKSEMEKLRQQGHKDIWMMGGAGIIGSFLDCGAIDEFIIHVIPTFIGEGIPLIAPRHRTVPLKLVSIKKFSDGVVRLHYAVGKMKSPRAAKK